jgi:hypothetical protein
MFLLWTLGESNSRQAVLTSGSTFMTFARLSEIGELQASSAIDRSHRVSPLPGQHLGNAPVDRDAAGSERQNIDPSVGLSMLSR